MQVLEKYFLSDLNNFSVSTTELTLNFSSPVA